MKSADGEITSIGDNFSHYAYTYTGQGDVASVDNAGTPGVPDVVLASGYDAAGNRKSLSATIAGAKDFLTSFSYNTLSQLDEIDQQGQSGGNAVAMKSIYFGLDAIGDVTQIDRSNSVYAGPNQNGPAYSVLNYSATTGLLTGINHEYMGASLDNLSYTYDTLARVSTFGSIDGTATYGYDATSQVTSASYTTAPGGHQPANESFTRDANGNNNAAGNVVSPDNHVTNDGTFIYQFDLEGNRTVRTRISTAYAADYKVTYAWDYRNRLTDVENFDNNGILTQHVHYVYDVFDHLIERDLDPNGSGTYTQIVHNIWDMTAPPSVGSVDEPPSAPGNVVLQTNGQQQLTARYLNGPNTSAYDQFFTTLAEEDVTSANSPGTVGYYLLDLEATLRDLVGADGTLRDHRSYSVFGQPASDSNPSAAQLGGFGGGVYDPATGLVYNVERWYDPTATVWLSVDPTGFRAGDMNLGRYVGANPTNFTDPSGLVLSKLQHESFQEDIQTAGELVEKGVISKGAAFSYLFGRLFQLARDGAGDTENGPCLNAPWISDFILTAMFYFTDASSTYKAFGIDVGKQRPADDYQPPNWLTRHDATGRKEGYIQLKGDADTTGRHDHLIANMYLNEYHVGPWLAAALERYQGEDSPTDKKVNKYGRFFTFDCQREYSQLDVTKLIYKNIVDETAVRVRHKGPLDNDSFSRLARQHLGKNP